MRRLWRPHSLTHSSAPYKSLTSEAPQLHKDSLPLGNTRQKRGRLLCRRTPSFRRTCTCFCFIIVLILLVFGILSSDTPSTYQNVRISERRLPQHNLTQALTGDTPYLRILGQVSGRGLNNVLQETILLSYLAFRVQRAYVFEDYVWSRLPLPYVVYDYDVRPSRLPLNAFISGPSAGGPMQGGPRAISLEFWETVCPPGSRHMISSADQPSTADGAVLLDWWIEKLTGVDHRCIEIDSRLQTMFDFNLFGSTRVLSIWPGLAKSPMLRDFAWSPLVHSAITDNAAILNHMTSMPNATPSTHHGLVAIHLRRGDFEGHCEYLARFSAEYMGFNRFPEMLDSFDPSRYQDQSARKEYYLEHCLPSIEQIVDRLRIVRSTNPGLKRVYVMTNGRRLWLEQLKNTLKADGWDDLQSSLDLRLDSAQQHVAMAVDMAIAEKAEMFIGNGFSSLSSNIVMLRMAKGTDPSMNRFL